MANEKRLIDANALLASPLWDSLTDDFDKARAKIIILSVPTVDAVALDQHNELKERYKRLLETADILDSALRAYQRKYGDLEGE